MEGMYGFYSSSADYTMTPPDNLQMIPAEYHSMFSSSNSGGEHNRRQFPLYGSDDLISAASAVSEAASITAEIRRSRRDQRGDNEYDGDENAYGVIKAKIASHPSYPKLLDAYLDCQKEYLRLKERYDSLHRLKSNFDGEELESLTSKELESMERQLNYSLKQIRSLRTQNMLDRLYDLQKQEHLLHETNKCLKAELIEGSQMRGLQWDIPNTSGAMYDQQVTQAAGDHNHMLLHPAAFCETTLQIGYQNDQMSGVTSGASLNNQMQIWPA